MIKKIGWPSTLGVVLLLVWAVLRFFFAEEMYQPSLGYLLAAALVGISVAVVRAVSYILFDVIFQKRKQREAPALLRFMLSIVVYPLLLLPIISGVLKKDLSGILATSAVVSVIIGLALQDTLGNFFAGISIHIEQPFHIGDSILVGNLIGKVESVTWRTTSIRTNNNTIITFPNSKVAREPIEIFPYGNLNRRVLQFPAPYSVPPEKIIPLVREVVRTMPNVASERTPIVRIASFADSSITYEILYWVIDYMWTPDMDAKIRERIWYLYSRNGIEIPYPHRQIITPERALPEGPRFDYEDILNRVEIFDPLTLEEKQEILKGMGRYLYAPGETVLRRGDAGSSMFVICEGKAEVRVPSNNGDSQVVAVLEKGAFFGEMALFTGEPRMANVNAVEELELIEIRKEQIEPLLNRNSELAEAFSNKIAERQARNAEQANRSIEQSALMQPKRVLNRIKNFFKLK